MRRAVVVIAALTALAALPATAPAAERPPLPELPRIYCDPGPCFSQLDGVRECVSGAVRAIAGAINGTPQPAYCDPTGRSAARPPGPHCDPMACPDPVGGVTGCVEGAKTAIRYIIQGTPQPQECNPWGN